MSESIKLDWEGSDGTPDAEAGIAESAKPTH